MKKLLHTIMLDDVLHKLAVSYSYGPGDDDVLVVLWWPTAKELIARAKREFGSKLDLSPLDNDGGSWDELWASMGLEARQDGGPGDCYEMHYDLALYWPWVRGTWEERGRVRM